MAAAVVSLPIAGIWWVATALLAGDHSACDESLSAELAFGASFVGIGLAIGALVAAVRRTVGIGWALLAIYAALLAASILIFFTCG